MKKFVNILGGLVLLATSCGTSETRPKLAWGKTVDSLLHDTVPLQALADSMRRLALTAPTDSAAIAAVSGMAEFLPVAFISPVADDVATQCAARKLQTLLPDVYCKQGIGLLRRQKNDTAATLFRASLQLARQQKNAAQEVQALCWLGDYFRLTYQFDSCEATLNEAIRLAVAQKNDARAAHARTFIGDLYRVSSKYDTARFIYDIALQEARRAGNRSREGFILTNIGDVFRLRNTTDSALFYFGKALAIADELNDDNRRAFVLANQGDMYRFGGKNPEALQCYNGAVVAAERVGDKRRMAHCHISMAELYNGQERYDQGIPHVREALLIARATGDNNTKAWALQVAGEAYRNIKQPDSAIAAFREAIQVSRKINHSLRLAGTLVYLADLYSQLKQYDSALVTANEGLLIAAANEDPANIGEAHRILAAVLFKQGHNSEALPHAQEAFRMGQESATPWLVYSAANTLSEIQAATGDYRNALSNHILFINIRDSTSGKAQYQRLATIEFEAKTEALKAEQAHKEAILEADKARQQQQIDRQRFLIWIAVGGALLLGGLLLVAWRAYRSKQRANTIIAEQKQQVETQKLIAEQKNREVMDSIAYARRLQEAILPPAAQVQQAFPESFVLYAPKDVVAGDFYWLAQRDGLLFLAAADCTGHGVPGALVSVVCSNAIKRAVDEFGLRRPGPILDKVTELVLETFAQSDSQVNDGMDISLLCLETATGTCWWAGANRPLWYVHNGTFTAINGDKQPVGHHENRQPFTTHEVIPDPGTMFYLFTDGFADQFGGPLGKKFKTKQLQETLLHINGQSAAQQQQALQEVFAAWRGSNEQVDDVCLIGFRS